MAPKVKYKTKRSTLDKILKTKDLDKVFIEKYILNVHKVAKQVARFIRCYITYLYKNKKQIPEINANLFKLCCLVLTKKDGRGGTLKGQNKTTFETLEKFYLKHYSKLNYAQEHKINSLHLSQMLDYIATEYETAVVNNITLNFTNYIKRYVNSYFIEKIEIEINVEYKDEISEFKSLQTEYLNLLFPVIESIVNQIKFFIKNKKYKNKKEFIIMQNYKSKYVSKYKNICKKLKINPTLSKEEFYDDITFSSIKKYFNVVNDINESFIACSKEFKFKQVRRQKNEGLKKLKDDLFKVKNDIIDNTQTADAKYKDFIENFNKNIMPNFDRTKFSLHDYLKAEPQKFILSMMKMVEILEEKKYKLFQFLPLYTSLIQRSVKIDTKVLVEIFGDGNKLELLNNIRKNQDKIWKDTFKIDNKIFKMSKSSPYIFDYSIVTNGYSASIIFIHKDEKVKKNNLCDNKNDIKKANRELFKDLSEQEKNKIKNERENKKNDGRIKKTEERNKKIKELKEEFKKKSKEEQNKIKEENKRKNKDYLYIDELNETELKNINEKLKINKVVTLDPGKKNLIYIQDELGNKFKYSNKEHITRTKRIKYTEKINKLREINGIKKEEDKLSNYNSKTVNFKDFCEYVKKRNEIENLIEVKYENKKFRQYKWYLYINKERAEANLINNIKKKFGDDIIIFYGDWSIGKQMANFISTPNLGLKKKINEHFDVYNLDEYNTSKLSNYNYKPCENLCIKDKFGIKRELHSVLTYKKEIKVQNENEIPKYQSCNINRDNNSSKNMLYIIKYFIENKKFPKEFSRNQKEILCCDIINIIKEKYYDATENEIELLLKNKKVKDLILIKEKILESNISFKNIIKNPANPTEGSNCRKPKGSITRKV